MKRVLFVSRSGLCQNLIRSVLPLIPFKVDLLGLESLAATHQLPKKGARIHLMIADLNCFEGDASPTNGIFSHPLILQAPKILIYPAQKGVDRGFFASLGFEGFYPKPFLLDELARMVITWTR